MSSKPFILAVIVAVFLLVPPSAPLRAEGPITGPNDASSSDTRLSNVILDEDDNIKDLLQRADKDMENGNWKEAIPGYQTALEKALAGSSSCVYGPAIETSGELSLRVSAREYCVSKLLAMNAEGLKFYRSRYEGAAETALRDAERQVGPDKLLAAAERYPLAASSIKALATAGAFAYERADFAFATRCYRRLVTIETAMRAQRGVDLPEYALLLAKAASAYAGAGADEELKSLKAMLSSDKALADNLILHCHRTVTLASFIDEMSTSCKPVVRTPVCDYPMPGGDSTRSLPVSGTPGTLGGLKWLHRMPVDEESIRWPVGQAANERNLMQILPVFLGQTCVVSSGRVLVDNGYIVYGLNDGDGREMFGFPILGEDASWHRYNLRAFSTSTVHDGVIYMSVLTWRTDKGMHLLYGRTLYAVNMHEGKEIWNTISATGLAPNEFVLGAPSIWGDSVLFTSYKGMEARADIILNCADARTGKLKWRCFLASVPNTYSYDTGKYAHLVAIEGDFGVVCSEGGMIAAVDLRNGCLAWVGEYKPDVGRDMVDGTGNRVQLPYDSPRRWAFNYPIVVSRRVYIKPQDSQNLYCLDPLTGQVKWTLKAPDMSYLVGVDDGKVFIIEKGVTVVDAATGKRLQSTPALKSLPAGRPAFTKTDIYISTLQSLLKYDRQTNEISVVFNWADKDLTPGNLVVTEDALYVANSEQVAAFFGPALAERLTKKLEKSPKDALLLYQRGRALLADNSLEKALSDFETALPLAGETAKYHNLPVREMINDGLYLCYVAMVRRCGSEGKIEDALKYSELALKRASTDETRFEASAALGEALEKGGDEAAWQKAIGRYQEIILQSPGVFRKFDGHLEQSAAFYAACRIDAILKTHGRSVYAGTEAEAAKLLAAAGNADEALLNVYKRYPNSMAALEALFRLAKKFEESGNTPMAIAALNTISDRFPKEADSAPANAMLYSLALKSGDYASARKALQTLAAMPETAQMKIGDKTVPVLDFAREKAAELDATTSALPGTGKLRNSPAPSQTMKLCGEKNQRYDGYTKFMGIINAQGPRPGHMSDKFLTFNGEIVECWDTATGGRLWLNTTLTPSIGISVSVRNGKEVFVQSVLRDQATDGAKLQVGDTILSVGGKEVNSLASFNQAVASLKMGDKVEVVFVSNGENRKTTLQSGPFSGIAGTITGARFNRDGNLVLCIADASRRILTEGWHPLYGEGNIVFRCVDSKTGQTLWNKTVREQNNVKQGPFEYRISATGLLTYYVGDKAGWWIEALDSANGKTVARVPASPHLYGAVMAGATDVMGIEVAPMTCHVYDILTGREKYRLPVSLDLDRMPLLAGNMVAFMDDSLAETLRVLDLRDGRVLYKAEHVSQYKAGASEKYLAVATPEKGGVIFDFLTGQPVAIDGWQAVPATVVLGGDYLCVEGHDNEGRNVFMQVYDARTGKATQCRIDMDPRTGQRFAWTKILGEYVVACYPVVINNMNAYVVIVTEIASGKEIYRGESQNQTATVDATITDGKLCITNGDAVTIIR